VPAFWWPNFMHCRAGQPPSVWACLRPRAVCRLSEMLAAKPTLTAAAFDHAGYPSLSGGSAEVAANRARICHVLLATVYRELSRSPGRHLVSEMAQIFNVR